MKTPTFTDALLELLNHEEQWEINYNYIRHPYLRIELRLSKTPFGLNHSNSSGLSVKINFIDRIRIWKKTKNLYRILATRKIYEHLKNTLTSVTRTLR